MNECNQCERYGVNRRNNTITCEFYYSGFCHATDRGTDYPTFEIEVWLKKNDELINKKFYDFIRLSPGESLEFWINDKLVHQVDNS